MAKRRKKSKEERRQRMKQTLLFELYGLVFLAISIIALVQPGAVGTVFRSVFRFFAGTWDFVIPLGMVILSLYIMFKRQWPSRWSYRWTGLVLFVCSFLIMAHKRLAESVSGEGRFADQSIFSVTWNLFLQDLSSETPVNIGGGMIGALLYGFLNFLFAEGTILIVFFLIIISIMLMIGFSYHDIFKKIKSMAISTYEWMKQKREYMKEMLKENERLNESEQNDSQKGNKKDTKAIEASAVTPLADEPTSVEGDVVQQSNDVVVDEHGKEIDPVIHDFTEVAYEESDDVNDRTASDQRETSIDTQDSNNRLQYEANASHVDGEDVSSVSSTSKGTTVETSAHDVSSQSTQSVVAYGENEELHYELPPYALLKKQSKYKQIGKQDMKSNARKLERTLESFGVNAKVTQVHRGPAVTRYEVHPAVGVKVSRIVNLTDDIALALAAKGIRIEAPIPGKSAVGIEVPNDDVAVVTLREVLETSSFHESESKLSIALGRDISGEPIVAQLNKMPHLLVAGATGSGKSVCINGIITSILYKAKPHEVKIMMIDPKMVELNVYNGIPHLLTPVVTDAKKAALALKKVVSEMERRYELFAQSGAREIEKYNELIRKHNETNPEAKQPLLPYIVVIIDELADLMMVAPGDVEDAICRLAQMARASGIHIIIATQRPSVDVITGVIKANIPSRIAFGVSSQADSRTILDMGGAEKLLGRGDMLFMPVGASKPLRIQGAFISDEEVEEIVSHCIEQQKAQYHEEMMPGEVEETAQAATVEDDLYEQAVDLVVQHGSASVSMLQRRFRIGYTRAARLIDSMEENGIVGPYEGSKPREVLVSKEQTNIS